MMVQRRHLENALPPELERSHLYDHRQALGDEHAANEDQKEFLFDDDRNRPDCSTKRERSDIAHENLGGMCVVPQESKAGAHHGSAENRQLARLPDVLNIKV